MRNEHRHQGGQQPFKEGIYWSRSGERIMNAMEGKPMIPPMKSGESNGEKRGKL